MATRPRVLSLCAGIGGLDLGLRLACGARTVGYVERDAFAAAVLVARMAEAALDPAPVWDDLSTFDGRAWRGRVDLVAAGIPCQPFSVAGKRRGLADERWLWSDVLRILDETAARALFLENVGGFTRHGLGRVLADLAARGFAAEWDHFRASDVGAPHRRERFFLLAHADAALRDESGWSSGAIGSGASGVRHAGEVVADRAGAGRKRFFLLANASDGLFSITRWKSEERDGPRPAGTILGHAERARLEGFARDGDDASGSAGPGAARSACASGSSLADTDGDARAVGRIEERAGIEGTRWSVAHGCGADGRLGWPPARNDADGWREWIAAGGPEPAVRRGADGTATRLDPTLKRRADEALRSLRYGTEIEGSESRKVLLDALLRGESHALETIEGCISQARTAGCSVDGLLAVRVYLESATASRRPYEANLLGDVSLRAWATKRKEAVEYRIDRLRCLGNAVVPAQAALAFRVLRTRLMEGE